MPHQCDSLFKIFQSFHLTEFKALRLSSDDKLILGLAVVFTGDPSTVHDKDGTGFPIALQDKVAFCPSSTVRFSG